MAIDPDLDEQVTNQDKQDKQNSGWAFLSRFKKGPKPIPGSSQAASSVTEQPLVPLPQEQIQTEAQEKKDPEQIAAELSEEMKQVLEIKGWEKNNFVNSERQAKLLNLMDKVDAYKADLGPEFVKTLGQGEDRVIIFKAPIKTTTTEPAYYVERKPENYLEENKRVGDITTNREQYLFMNKSGIYKFNLTPETNLKVDLQGEFFKKAGTNPDVEQKHHDDHGTSVIRYESQEGRDMFFKIMNSDEFPADPGKDPALTSLRHEVNTPAYKQAKETYDKANKLFWFAKIFQPEESNRMATLEDTDFDRSDGRYRHENQITGDRWFDRGFSLIRVTKPEFAGQAVKASVDYALMLRSSRH